MSPGFPRTRSQESGTAQIEFALCAVFIVFLLISIFDMARGLWIYHTLAEAVRDGTRYSIVRGEGYANPNTNVRLPGARLADVRDVVLRSAVGLVSDQLDLKFEVYGGGVTLLDSITCSPASTTSCPWNSNWPPNGLAAPNLEVGIKANYPYNSLVVMFFPGSQGVQFGKFILGSTARERIVF